VTRRYVPSLLLLAAVWGASYLFIKVAVRDLEPAAMIELRLLLAAPILIGFVMLQRGRETAVREMRGAWREGLVLGALNAAIPFTLIAWGEKHVDSGVAAVGNASVPIFVALLAIPFAPSQRSTGLRLVGVLVGLGGVAILAGVDPRGGWWAVAGTLAVILSSVSYAGANIVAHRRMAVGGPVLAGASMVGGLILLLPLALTELPDHMPGWKALASVAALGILGTGLAQIVLYRMLAIHGPSRSALVAYLLPPFALVYGVLFLGEPITTPELAGLVLILGGVALGAGAVRFRRRAPQPA
jgi:drug/metabolite transporter (DMT)-like permease